MERWLAALLENPSLVPSTNIWSLTNPLTLAPGDLILSFSSVDMYIHVAYTPREIHVSVYM